MGAGGDGPLGGMAGMEPHHMNGSIGIETKFSVKLLIMSNCQIMQNVNSF